MGALTAMRQLVGQNKQRYEDLALKFESIELIIDVDKGRGRQHALTHPIKGLTEYGNASYSPVLWN